MICYGCCLAPTRHFDELALPAVSAILEPPDRVLTVRDAKSITSAYNTLIDQARALADLEALVLFHEDVVLHDRNFAPRVRRVLRDPTVGVIGVVGASRLCNMSFWDGRTTKGRAWDGTRFLDFGPPRGDVDVVDGLLMVLSPAALDSVRFDDTTFTGFHGYDVDYCLSCRKAGLRVVVEPFSLYHRSTGNMSSSSYTDAQAAFTRKWGRVLSRPSPLVTLLPDRARRSEVRGTTADFRLAVRRGLDQARTRAGAALQRTRHNVWRRLDSAEPRVTSSDNGPNGADVSYEMQTLSSKACLLCGQPMERTRGGLPLVSCERCQVFGTWPPPRTDDSGSEIFDLSYDGERSRRRRQWIYEARQRLAWIETWMPDGILLEVGCATGEFIKEATAAGYEAIGVEPSKWAADIARRSGAEVLCGKLADWTAEYAGFTVDSVAMFHVLEHLEDPLELLRQCRSVLADDGRVFIEVPNAYSCAAKSLDPSWVGWEFRFHQWHFTPSSLKSLLVQAGLETLELRQVTARLYLDRAGWGRARAENWAAGHSTPNMDYIRVVAGRLGMAHSADDNFASQ
jgi:SAM-dependent methyltransferase